MTGPTDINSIKKTFFRGRKEIRNGRNNKKTKLSSREINFRVGHLNGFISYTKKFKKTYS